MSIETQSDGEAEPESELQPDDEAASPALENEVVELLRDVVGEEIARVDQDGERVKRAIASVIVRQQADHEAAQDLHEELASLVRGRHREENEVGLAEIAMALWTELNCVVATMTRDPDEEEDDADREDGAETETTGGRGDVGDGRGGRSLPSGDGGPDSSADPTFH